MKIVKFIVFLLFGLMFINAGLDKFIHYMPMPKMDSSQMELMQAMVKISWLMPLVGAIEVLGGLLCILPKTRALGALVIFPVMVGILLHNVCFFSPSGVGISGVLMIINLWMIILNLKKYTPIVA